MQMKKTRKLTVIFLIALMVFTLVLSGCGGGDTTSGGNSSSSGAADNSSGNSSSSGSDNSSSNSSNSNSSSSGGDAISLKVWGSQDDQAMLTEMIESFKAANPDKTFNIDLGVVGENDAMARYLEDPAAAADVFAFAHDQLKPFVNSGSLYEVAGRWKEAVIADNGPGSVEAATRDGKLYAFPMTADNGYFMYYDSSVFTEADVQSLDKMLEVASAAGKKVYFDLANGWYNAAFFLAAGCDVGLDDNGNPFCTFNDANGIKAAEAIKALANNSAYISGKDEILTGGMGADVAAGVSGTWNAAAVKEKLGANYAAAKLPTVNLGGAQVQLSSFAGYKLVGVSKLTSNPQEAMDLAAWLTNYDNQMKRFEARGIGPSNTKAGASPEVQASPELAALAAQSAFAVAQNDVPDNFWNPTEAFGQQMIAGDTTDLQILLNEMVDKIIT